MNPALSVPSMLASSLGVVYEAVLTFFFVALVLNLNSTGLLDVIARQVGTGDWDQLLGTLSSPSFTQPALEFMIPAFILILVIAVLTSGFIASAEFYSYRQALEGIHVGVQVVASNFAQNWRVMAWTQFLSYSISFLPLLGGFGAVLAILAFNGPVVLVLLVVLMGLVGGPILTAYLSLRFVYSPVVVAVEGTSGLAAIRRSYSQAGRNFRAVASYGIVLILLTLGISYIAGALPFSLPLSSLASVSVLIIVTPILHLMKTAMYLQLEGKSGDEPVFYEPFMPDMLKGLPRYIWATFAKGLKETKRFALSPRNFVYHALSAAGFILGWAIGSLVAHAGVTNAILEMGYVPGRINPAVTGSQPATLGAYIFFHNWQVSLATGLSGVWFSVAPFATLVVNGMILGVVATLVPNTTMLAAAILPHGIIEIPSLILAGSAGMKLGMAFLKSRNNPGLVLAFNKTLRQTVYILVGLALLFLIAGMIEAGVTPVIMRMAGWT
jgi:uncharacterized membrane protein SpoIIM required for sporulation